MSVGSIQAAVRSVFGGMNAELAGRQTFAKTWPLFQLAPQFASDRRGAELSSIVEGEIIPRLVVAHGPAPTGAHILSAWRVDSEAPTPGEVIETCARLSLARRGDVLETFFGDYLQPEALAANVYTALLAPTARLLIDLWSRDRISYTEVTIALGRLQHLVRKLDEATPYNGNNDPVARSAFFTPRPGEQQTFGFHIIEEQFRWSGWRTWIEPSTTAEEINAVVRGQWFDLLCISATRDERIEDICRTVAGIRRASRNPDLFILANGFPFLEHPELVGVVGVDAAANDGEEALDIMSEAARRHAA